MQHPFDADSPHRGELTSLVSRAVDIDARIRALQAERATVFAQAYDLAEREGTRPLAAAHSANETDTAHDTDDIGSAASTDVGSPDTGGLGNADAADHVESTESAESAASDVVSAAFGMNPSLGAVAFGTGVSLPRGAVVWRDRSHRVIRTELACALNVSEWTVSNDLAHATDTLTHFPALHAAQARGEVTEKHVRSAVDAGRVIGVRATPLTGSTLVDDTGTPLSPEAADAEVERRYALFDQALLPYAQSLTPALLVPVAKRIAEKLAGATFDDRHRIAKRDRRVVLTELDDGMCSLTAYVTSLEGHAIFDRVTQYAKQAQRQDITAATKLDNTDARDASAAAEVFKRPLAEARADSFVALLLNGEPDDQETHAQGGFGDTGRKKIGPHVTARVQVLVPVSLTGRLDTSPAAGPGGGVPDLASRTGSGVRPSTGAGTGGATASGAGPVGTPSVAPQPTQVGRPGLVTDGVFQPELVGVGPIDTDTAARIMHDTPTWDMIVVTDNGGNTTDNSTETAGTACPTCHTSTSTSTSANEPGAGFGVGSGINTTGDILTVDGYRVPAHLRRHLAARDEHCRFPGCTLPIYRCDIDHTIAAEHGGPTAHDNLSAQCRGHHIMKHHGGLHPKQPTPGTLTWTLPSGRTYTTTPPSKVTFATALEPPNIQALNTEYTRKYPYGQTDWDTPAHTTEATNPTAQPPGSESMGGPVDETDLGPPPL